jgi:5'-nucleotidase
MDIHLDNTLVIAISSRALFDLEESHRLFTEQGIDAYCRYQIDHENEILAPGVAFSLVKKFLLLNNDKPQQQVEIVLISRNSADTGLRVFNSIQHYGLDITRAAFTNGESPYRYLSPFKGDLFLSADPSDVRKALDSGVAAATILPSKVEQGAGREKQLRIAFDGDAVIFSDIAEKMFQDEGLEAFSRAERSSANQPLPDGPFKNILDALHNIQQAYPTKQSPIRTALFTARAAPAHERVIRTLRAWNIRIDEAVFLGGLDKGDFLQTFGADIYFDDQEGHCESTRKHVATGHVPHGVAND